MRSGHANQQEAIGASLIKRRRGPSFGFRWMLHGLAFAAALVLFADVAQAQQLAVPTLLEPTAGNEQVTLTWSSTDLTIPEYEYQYRADNDTFGDAIKIPNSDSSNFKHTVTGLDNGTRYTFEIRSKRSSNVSRWSNSAEAIPLGPPAAPTNLTANAGDPAYSAISLTWKAPAADTARAAVSGYLLEWSANSSGPWTEIDLSGETGTSYQHSGLAAASTYHYRVYARSDASGDSDASAVASADTAIAPPAAPTGLTADPGDAQVTLKWDDPGDSSIDKYRYSTDDGANHTDIADSANITSHTVTGLTNGTAYTFEIQAHNTSGWSASSNQNTATPLGPPAAPTNLTANAVDPAYSAIKLTWTAPAADAARAPATGYLLEWSTNSSGPWTQIDPDLGAHELELTHSGLAAASTYHYRVYARSNVGDSDNFGDSDASAVASADTAIAPPAAPTNLTANAVDPAYSAIELTWTAPAADAARAAVSGYLLEWSANSSGPWTEIDLSGETGTSYQHSGLAAASTYHYRVYARSDASGDSDASAVASADTAIAPPAAPTGLTADPGDAQVTLKWDDPGDSSIDKYRYSTDDGANHTDIADSANIDQPHRDRAHQRHRLHLRDPGPQHQRLERIVQPEHGDPAGAAGGAHEPDRQRRRSRLQRDQTDVDRARRRRSTRPGDRLPPRVVHQQQRPLDPDRPGSGNHELELTHSGLAAASTYHYRVYARSNVGDSDNFGDSAASAVASADTAIAPPEAPTGLSADPGNEQVKLSWNNLDDDTITGYRYRQSTNGGRTFGTPIAIPGSNKSTTYHTVEDLTNGTKYTFEVESVRKGQNYSGWSNQATATPLRPRFVPQFAPAVVEPPLAEPQFVDVDPSSVHANNIQTLLAAGITTGCGTDPPMYCPDRAVTRAQMASFVVRALKMHTASPRKTERIIDVDPSSVHANNIDVLFAAGITTGCGTDPPMYCPDRAVTRAQMASFLVRAVDLPAEAFSRRAPKIMDLDSSSVHATNIKALFAARITTGCHTDPLMYCPDRPVTRAQMASFLVRAFDLD